MTDALEYEPPLFDDVPQGGTPPTPVVDEAGRKLEQCGTIGPRSSWTDPQDRKEKVRPPKCNRTAGHDGPHQRINRNSFGIEAAWT